MDYSWKRIDHKLSARAFIHQETLLALPSNCLIETDLLKLLGPRLSAIDSSPYVVHEANTDILFATVTILAHDHQVDR